MNSTLLVQYQLPQPTWNSRNILRKCSPLNLYFMIEATQTDCESFTLECHLWIQISTNLQVNALKHQYLIRTTAHQMDSQILVSYWMGTFHFGLLTRIRESNQRATGQGFQFILINFIRFRCGLQYHQVSKQTAGIAIEATMSQNVNQSLPGSSPFPFLGKLNP